MSLEDSFNLVVGKEGRYSNDPDDSGGETMFGITVAVARANGYNGPMHEMPLAVAKTIYKRHYWDTLQLDRISQLSNAIAFELFDTGVNTGIAVAAKYLQRTLNVLNRQQKDYKDILVDGVLGNMTVYTLSELLKVRGKAGEAVVLKALNCLQGAGYIELAERREKDETFVFGWLANRVEI